MEDTTTAIPINSMTDDEMRQELADNGVTLHHKTGTKKLASTLADVRSKEYKENTNSGSTEASRAAKAKHLAAMKTP